MLSQVVTRRVPMFIRQSVRLFSTPVEKPKAPEPAPGAPAAGTSSANMKSATHKVDKLERRMLVWTGKYKTVDEVPSYINQDVMEKARNRIRIRLANVMMALTALGCLLMVYSGKKAADRGESVTKQNQDWHKEYNEQSKAEAEAKAALKK